MRRIVTGRLAFERVHMAGSRGFEVFRLDSEAFQARLGASEASPAPVELALASRRARGAVCGHPTARAGGDAIGPSLEPRGLRTHTVA